MECYRIYKLKLGEKISPSREWMLVGRLIAAVFFTAYLNFGHLQHQTDFYIRKYGYMEQYTRAEANRLQDNGEWDLTQIDKEIYGERKEL